MASAGPQRTIPLPKPTARSSKGETKKGSRAPLLTEKVTRGCTGLWGAQAHRTPTDQAVPPPTSGCAEAAVSAPAASPLDATGLRNALRQSNISNQLTLNDSSEALDRLKNGQTGLTLAPQEGQHFCSESKNADPLARRTKILTFFRS